MKVHGMGMVLACALTLAFGSNEVQARKSRSQKMIENVQRQVESGMAQTPKDLEVCFAPDDPCDAKLVKFIDSATTSIDVAVFDINLDQVVHHLLVASKKIPVRILVDRRMAAGRTSLVKTLVKGGIPIKFGVQRGIMHNKFTIVDGKAVETGSFNYTNGAAFKNNENQVYLFNPEIVARYKKRFEKIWNGGESITKD